MAIVMRMVYLLLALLAVVALLMLASRLWPASAMQQQARAALEQPLDWPGDNAWALLETLDHDGLDMAQRQALVDGRVRRFTVWQQENARLRAAGEYRQTGVPALGGQVTTWPRSDVLCERHQAEQCLDKVRQAPDAVAAALAQRQPRLQRVAQLADYGHVRSPYPGDVSMPNLHTTGALFDSLSAHALAHVQGNSDQALAGLCRDMASGRMLLTRSDSLIHAMVGNAMLVGNTQMLGQVLAELPAGHALPSTCTAALVPLQTSDLGLCRAMRMDYAISGAAIADSYQYEMDMPGSSWLFNVDKTMDRIATGQAQGCFEPIQQQLAQDLPAVIDASVWSLWKMECPANAVGCLLTSNVAVGPGYAEFMHRAQDAAAQQRLLGALVWLREQPALTPEDIAQQLQKLPAGLVSAQRPITLSTDGRALQVSQRYYRKGPQAAAPMRVSLPSAWWPQVPAASAP